MEVKELEASIHEVLGEVEGGQTIDITRQGKVVARMTPVQQAPQSHLRRDENEAWAKLNTLIDEISDDWPEGVSAQDAINDVRREL